MPGSTQFRRLVLMFDGTWNERSNLTNVARMFEAVDDYKPDKDDEVDPDAEPVQLVRYLKGVGTNFFGRVLGGAVGYGLSDIIKEGYRWLSNNYKEGDEIYVFGFSRGAYSARSLVSLVHRCGGVLTRKPDEPEIKIDDIVLTKAYTAYRGYVETTDGANAAYEKQLKEFSAKYCQPVTIKMLGVWDTVGALGIPDSVFTLKSRFLKSILEPVSNALADYLPHWSRKYYGFHDQGLPCIVENAYHALAIDENRKDFDATLWDMKTPQNKEVKQFWFVGSHCNVGGGVSTGNADQDPDDLWQYSYVWMQNKAIKHGLRFYWTYGKGNVTKTNSAHKLVSSKSGTIKDRRRVSRTKTQDSYAQMLDGWYAYLFPERFYRDVVGSNKKGASLHWSVKERIEQDKSYQPESLKIPSTGPEKPVQFYTEIPDMMPLQEKKCSCKPESNQVTTANGRPTKKHS